MRLNYCVLGRQAAPRLAWMGPSGCWLHSAAQRACWSETRPQLTPVGSSAPRSRSVRPCGGGVNGGVMAAMGGMGIILMLSSASAPSRVPQVVWRECQQAGGAGAGLTDLCHGNAAIQLDEIVEIPKQDRHGHEADVARVS